MLEQAAMRLRVPSIRRFRVTAADSNATPATVMHDYEEYELGPASGPDHVYEYIWINPADHLRDYVRELTTDLTKARASCRRETQRADDLVEDAGRWRSFKGLIQALNGGVS